MVCVSTVSVCEIAEGVCALPASVFFDTTAFFVSLPFELFMFSSDLKWKEE